MEAMIFAAGLGTRLRPLTNDKPKALVEVCGKTLLQHCIELLIRNGVTRVVINVHHFAEMMKTYIANLKYDIDILISDESDLLLDTGGGLKKAIGLFSGKAPIMITNVDILSNIDLQKMLRRHIESKADATLAIRERKSSRYLLFDNNLQLKGWQNTKTCEAIYVAEKSGLSQYAFSGIHIISPSIIDKFPDDDVFPIIPHYLKLASSHKIIGYPHQSDYWFDAGSVEKIAEAEAFLKNN
ncbi:MAG: nucleotidyltransferase family protein [Salinivirgaceae bacterium]|nr:nucleotidyltransferase family protein [Salinivirgaceae bacterium]